MSYIAHEQIAINRQLAKESSIDKYLQPIDEKDIYKSLFLESTITQQYTGLLIKNEIHYSVSPLAELLRVDNRSTKSSYSLLEDNINDSSK